MKSLPKIALTIGDVAGVGPEIAVKIAANRILKEKVKIILYGPNQIINMASAKFANNEKFTICDTGNLDFSNVIIGQANAKCGEFAYKTVIQATNDTINGKVDAIVTAPMCKASVNLANIPFTGHTELIAQLCKTANYAMMQSSGDLRVIFVTTHIPLKNVSESISTQRIIDVTNLLNNIIIKEGISSPKIAIAAINPHAGEDGYMGDEDEQIVKPAIAELAKNNIIVEGPFPSDTLFIDETRKQFDGIVSMYHDQGHIPFKMLAFDNGVNSTLGLPIIRTSVDHGTAFNLAWQGIASTNSLYAAIELALKRIN